jgi:hypothetical protein
MNLDAGERRARTPRGSNTIKVDVEGLSFENGIPKL